MGVQLKVVVPAGFGPRLNKPELVVGINAEFRIHDDAAVSLAYRTHTLGNAFGLAERKRPTQSLKLGNFNLAGAAAFVIDDLHVFAAHLTDDNFATVVALEDIKLVGRNLAAHHSLAEAVAGVDADQLAAVSATAARGGIGREGRTRNDRVDHLHHADRKRGVLDGPLKLGGFCNAFVAGFFGLGQRIEDGLAAVGHGTQIVGRRAVPVVGFHNLIFTHHVKIGVLKTGKSLFARIFASG